MMADDFYDETERIRFGWGGRLALLALVLALCLLAAGCASPGPVHRTLDRDVGVICYYTRAGISCLPVTIDDGALHQDLATLPAPDKPTDTPTAGKRRQGD